MQLPRTRIAELVVARHVASGATVVDFGCGPGFLSAALSGRVAAVVACDISDGALACAETITIPHPTSSTFSFLPPGRCRSPTGALTRSAPSRSCSM